MKYKNSLVLGKFYGLHNGHCYLIDTAISKSDIVHIIITHNKLQSIPGYVRYNALMSIYGHLPNVKIYLVSDDGIPQHPDPNKPLKEFYDFWCPLVYAQVKELDVIFTSEDYGDEFAHFLGIDHILVDKERKKFPISGTLVRSDPNKYWGFIPNEMRSFFIKRIVAVGPESCGKSTLIKKLSDHYQTNFVEEYGRTFYEKNGINSIDDFVIISNGRQELEDSIIKDSNKLIFCDTEDITTYIFSKMFFPEEFHKIEGYFKDTIQKKQKYDLYLLMKPDCDPVQDGTRLFIDERMNHYNVIKSELITNGCNFIEIGGDWDSRFEEAKSIIDYSLQIQMLEYII